MGNSLIVGITGILGSGKTTVCKIIRKYNFEVISCDAIVNQLLQREEIIKKLINILGEEVVKNGKIDRKKVREIIFNDYSKKKKVENLLHPFVFEEIKNRILDIRKKGGIIFVEIPLLFETKSENLFDRIIVVYTSRKKIKERLRDKYTEEEIKKIWKSQLPISFKKRKAHFLIDNSYSFFKTKKQVERILKKLTRELDKKGEIYGANE